MVAHVYNPSYSGGRGQEDHGSRLAQVKKKKIARTISTNKLGMMVHAYKPSYMGDTGRRIVVQAWPGKKHKTLSEK
jgi:hypothetical protein